MRKTLAPILLALLAACGGGGGDSRPKVVAFYGDSITAGRAADIAQGKFEVQDFAVPAQTSSIQLRANDISTHTVLRYGMVDAYLNYPAGVTRDNLLRLSAAVKARGAVPVIVNVSCAENRMQEYINEAIKDLVNVDVTDIPCETVDGVHPTEAYHGRLNERIRLYLEKL